MSSEKTEKHETTDSTLSASLSQEPLISMYNYGRDDGENRGNLVPLAGTTPHNSNSMPIRDEHKKLGLYSFAVIVFYSVSGGPFGIEPTVRAGGFFFAIMGFLIFPFIWSIPEALITAELGSAYPEESGGVAWVEEAFGPRAALVMGYLSYISGATDNAIYPVLFIEYFIQIFSSEDDIWDGMGMFSRFTILAIISFSLTVINYLGLKIVGNVSIVIALVAISPIVVMIILGIPQIDPSRWLQLPMTKDQVNDDDDYSEVVEKGLFTMGSATGVLWRPFLNNLFWNLNSFDSGANFSADVRDLHTSFPRGMFLAAFLVSVAYLVPLLVAIGATDSTQEDWVDGYISKACQQIGGHWLGIWAIFAIGISNIGLFEAEMSADAFRLMGMADRGLLPKVFSKRSKYGTPTYGIMMGFTIILCMSVADFSTLVEMLNFNYAIALLIEYAAFIWLRINKSEVHRPYRVPLNIAGCIALIIPPSFFIVLLLIMASYDTYIYFIASSCVGLILFILGGIGKKFRWCEFTKEGISEIPTETSLSEVQTNGEIL